MRSIALFGSVGLVAVFMLAQGATAQTSVVPGGTMAFSNPVDSAVLASQRGGNQLVRNDMELSGTTADNTARNVNTGSNAISSGSFANMSGLPVVIQNTGANVLIQNAVILHLQMN
ncbi:hypothetical protein J7E70_27905 [Variovorax paradoxus]|nr:hypothetical protein [Variovorax paradoxus]MBT2304263.1 hypothetical protein [Variovorax paradoxus]